MPFGPQSSSWDSSFTPLWRFPRAVAGPLVEPLPSWLGTSYQLPSVPENLGQSHLFCCAVDLPPEFERPLPFIRKNQPSASASFAQGAANAWIEVIAYCPWLWIGSLSWKLKIDGADGMSPVEWCVLPLHKSTFRCVRDDRVRLEMICS